MPFAILFWYILLWSILLEDLWTVQQISRDLDLSTPRCLAPQQLHFPDNKHV